MQVELCWRRTACKRLVSKPLPPLHINPGFKTRLSKFQPAPPHGGSGPYIDPKHHQLLIGQSHRFRAEIDRLKRLDEVGLCTLESS